MWFVIDGIEVNIEEDENGATLLIENAKIKVKAMEMKQDSTG